MQLNWRKHADNICLLPAVFGVHFVLLKQTKILWKHFETLRLKLVRVVYARTKLSRKAWFKQKRHKTIKVEYKKPSPSKQKSHNVAWYTGFPHTQYIIKSKGSRMGKGKGRVKHWYFSGMPGHTLVKLYVNNPRVLLLLAHKILRLIPCAAYITAQKTIRRIKRTRWNIDKIKFINIKLHLYLLISYCHRYLTTN